MEIYNFANYRTKPKTFGNLNFRLPSLQKTSFSAPAKKSRRMESARAISGTFSFHSFLVCIGSTITKIEEVIREDFKMISICVLSMVLAVLISITGYELYSYFQNHTSPIVLTALQESEIARLDQMMADFAMDNYGDINEWGDITNTENIAVPVFAQPVTYQDYKVQKGEAISTIAKKFGLSSISTLISVNNISNVRSLAVGQALKIPSIDGILYTVKSGDTIKTIAESQGISLESLLDVNDLDSEVLQPGQVLFLPGAKLDQKTLSLAMGDQFVCPIKAAYRFSSKFGWRTDPISGKESYHKGDDLACPARTPIFASMSGKVIYVGESWLYGKHIIIDHGNGYQTLYAHMSQIIATKDQWVNQDTRIGLVGSTGYSTGPHLHFTVYKNGNPIAPSTVVRY